MGLARADTTNVTDDLLAGSGDVTILGLLSRQAIYYLGGPQVPAMVVIQVSN